MTNCVFDLKNLYRNTHNFSPFKYFTPLLVIFNTACGGGGGGGGATINPPKITAPQPGLKITLINQDLTLGITPIVAWLSSIRN